MNTNTKTEEREREKKLYFPFFLLDLLLRFRSFNSPGDAGIQTATVNKQDYPFEHARKSYHIGAGNGMGSWTEAISLTEAETQTVMVGQPQNHKKIFLCFFFWSFLLTLQPRCPGTLMSQSTNDQSF